MDSPLSMTALEKGLYMINADKCEIAIERLENGLAIDEEYFEIARDELKYALSRKKSYSYEIETARDLLDRATEMNDLLRATNFLIDSPMTRQYVPARLAFAGGEVISDVYVVHFTSRETFDKYISNEGLQGPEDIRGLFHTYGPLRSLRMSEDGYLFGYLIKDASDLRDASRKLYEKLMSDEESQRRASGVYDYDDSEYDDSEYDDSEYDDSEYENSSPWQCVSQIGLIMKVSYALEVYHPSDEEEQLIFPISCIDQGSFDTFDVDYELV